MFQSLTHIGHTYCLTDSDFSHTFVCYDADFTLGAGTIAEVIKIYEARKLPVAANIARLYWFNRKGPPVYTIEKWLRHDAALMDDSNPELQYTKKYFGCVLRHLDKLAIIHKDFKYIKSRIRI